MDGYDQKCKDYIAADWKPMRLKFDLHESYTGTDFIQDQRIRDWIMGKILVPTQQTIQNMLNVKRIPGPLILKQGDGVDTC